MRAVTMTRMNSTAAATDHNEKLFFARVRMLTRRQFLLSSLAACGGAAAYAAFIEPFWLDVVTRPLALPGLPSALRGARLVQLSDLHISAHVSEAHLLRSFARVEALRPEIVVYTGDFMTLARGTRELLARLFPRLPHGRLATLGVLGNHDYGVDWREPMWADEIVRLATNSGVRILRNEVASVDGLQIVGLDDLWSGRCDPAAALARRESAGPALVLSHNPDSLDAGDWRGYHGWVLSGHTHGGQCKPPFLPAPLLPVRNRRYTAGEIALADGRTVYINRGLGYLLQARFNARPEITVFTLT